MNKQKKFNGVMPALFSVYDENMNVKRDTVKKMVDYQIENGVSGFYVGGNTGECTVLPITTREQMLEATVQANNGRRDIIAHVGAGQIEDAFKLIDRANEMDIGAIASLPPSLTAYYDIDEVLSYYKMIAKRSKHPVLAYVTYAVNGDMYAFAKKIAEIDNIIGLKISVPDYYSFGRICTIDGGRLNILNGPDETLICGLSEGADGAIGTSYNILPKLAVSIYENYRKGDNVAALEGQRKLNEVIGIAISENIAYWKAMMTIIGFDMGYTVSPQRLMTSEDIKALQTKLDAIGFFDML